MQPAVAKFNFPKSQHLKSSLYIRKIVSARQYVTKYPIKCFFETLPCEDDFVELKVAFLVSKRKFKHATDRNRVKRLFREAFRLKKHHLDLPENTTLNMCWMFVGDEIPTFQQVEAAAIAIFAKITDFQKSQQ